MYPSPPTSPPSRPAPAAVAILYPKVGNVLRVPLRRTRPGGGPDGCAQHPERQFIVWFNRMMAARPGFPLQIKSILLLTGAPLCESCHQALARYLGRYHLAGKLRLRSTAPATCGCGGRGSARPAQLLRANDESWPGAAATYLDDLMTEVASSPSEEDEQSFMVGRFGRIPGRLAATALGLILGLSDPAATAPGSPPPSSTTPVPPPKEPGKLPLPAPVSKAIRDADKRKKEEEERERDRVAKGHAKKK